MGAVILIALGVLLILSNSGVYGFDKSWPILFIVIAVTMLLQRVKDLGAWIIGAAGVGFFVMKNFYPHIQNWGKYAFPVLLIALGGYILFKRGGGSRVS
jgi:cadmium resistance protein CadD (predicted permease)